MFVIHVVNIWEDHGSTVTIRDASWWEWVDERLL
jgi:hypothetical protein